MAERELPLFPLNVVLFPSMRLPLHIFEERYKLMIGTCMVTDQTFGVALIESGEEVGGPAQIFKVGTTARIVEIDRLPDGQMNLVVIGVDRFKLLEQFADKPYATGRVELLPEIPEAAPAGLSARVAHKFRRYLISAGVPEQQAAGLALPDDPQELSYVVAAVLKAPARRRQRLLEDTSIVSRLTTELALLEWATGGPTDLNGRSFSIN